MNNKNENKSKNFKRGQGTGNAANMTDGGSIIVDPNGSYTGVPIGSDPNEQPVQDVDDL